MSAPPPCTAVPHLLPDDPQVQPHHLDLRQEGQIQPHDPGGCDHEGDSQRLVGRRDPGHRQRHGHACRGVSAGGGEGGRGNNVATWTRLPQTTPRKDTCARLSLFSTPVHASRCHSHLCMPLTVFHTCACLSLPSTPVHASHSHRLQVVVLPTQLLKALHPVTRNKYTTGFRAAGMARQRK